MSDQPPILDLVQKHIVPERFAQLNWQGSFAEYLDIVESRPLVVRNAWQRLLDMIAEREGRKTKSAERPRGERFGW